ncbi:MAG: hydrolase [Pseudomonadota bacterium]|nr:hydrolase [Pseudomonadota bacterium]
MVNRREFLGGAAALAAAAWTGRVAAEDLPPIVFVHGDSDSAAIWQSVFWRFESNGYPREKLFAISFTNPQARSDNAVEQADRSSTDDELKELTAFVDAALAKTGAAKAALVANSRGCNAARNYLRHGGADKASHAVLCGGVNHGVFTAPATMGSEYNSQGPFLTDLNSGDETTPGVKFLTLRSDGYDLYAQPDGAYIGRPGAPTGVTSDGPALKGATNLVLDRVDHRETAFSPRAFAEIYKFIVGKAPERIAIVSEAKVTLNGAVTGVDRDTPTNKPVAGAKVEIYAVDADTGARKGAALLSMTTGADGVWGPFDTDPTTALEFVIAAPGNLITHIYRSPFPRSFALLNLRPAIANEAKGEAAAIVTMNRPRGYFGSPRDVILIDGGTPAGIPPGVPAKWRLPVSFATLEDRPIVCEFNQERIVAREWPLKDKRISIAELTY